MATNWDSLHKYLTEVKGMLSEMENQIDDLKWEIDCALEEIEELPRVDGKYVKDSANDIGDDDARDQV